MEKDFRKMEIKFQRGDIEVLSIGGQMATQIDPGIYTIVMSPSWSNNGKLIIDYDESRGLDIMFDINDKRVITLHTHWSDLSTVECKLISVMRELNNGLELSDTVKLCENLKKDSDGIVIIDFFAKYLIKATVHKQIRLSSFDYYVNSYFTKSLEDGKKFDNIPFSKGTCYQLRFSYGKARYEVSYGREEDSDKIEMHSATPRMFKNVYLEDSHLAQTVINTVADFIDADNFEDVVYLLVFFTDEYPDNYQKYFQEPEVPEFL